MRCARGLRLLVLVFVVVFVPQCIGRPIKSERGYTWPQWRTCEKLARVRGACGKPPPGSPPAHDANMPTPKPAMMYRIIAPPTPVPPTPMPTPVPTPLHRPRIEMRGANPMRVLIGRPYHEPGAHCSWNIRGDLDTSLAIVGDRVDTSAPGHFRVRYLCRGGKVQHWREAVAQVRDVFVSHVISPPCAIIKVAGLSADIAQYARQFSRLGEYRLTEQYHDGRPVYRQVSRARHGSRPDAALAPTDTPNYLYYVQSDTAGVWVVDAIETHASRHRGFLARGNATQAESIVAPWRAWNELKEVWQSAGALTTSCVGHRCENAPVWGTWTKCTLPCGGGHHIRTRNVAVTRTGGGQPACTAQVQLGVCNTQVCADKYVGMELQRLRGIVRRKAATSCSTYNVLGRWSQCTARCSAGLQDRGVRYRIRGRHICLSTGRALLRTWRQIEPCSLARNRCKRELAKGKGSQVVSAPPLTQGDLEHSKWLATFQPPQLRPEILALDEHAALLGLAGVKHNP